MTNQPSFSTVDLRPTLDAICDDFAAALENNASVRIEEFVERAPRAARRVLIVELVGLHAEHRRDSGESVSAEDYTSQFPDCADDIHERLTSLLSSRPWTSSTRAIAPATLRSDRLALAPATRLGRYQIRHLLGRGGFGEVWEADDPILARPVAVKLLRPNRAADPKETAALLEEGRRLAQLNHENIVRVLDAGNQDQQIFLVSELLSGGTLASRISAMPPVPVAVRWIATIARALHHAHERGFIHRDIKPSNILFDDADVPHLSDFGLALTEADRPVEPPGMVGTVTYVSPEQGAGKHELTDARSDIYSLGMVLYRLLAGCLPGELPTEASRDGDRRLQPPSLRVRNRNIPSELDAICRKCLHAEPDHRFQSAQMLAGELNRWLDAFNSRRARLVRRWLTAAMVLLTVALAVAAFRPEQRQVALDDPAATLAQLAINPPVWAPTTATHFFRYLPDEKQFEFSIYDRAGFVAGTTRNPAIDLAMDWTLASPSGCVGLFWSPIPEANERQKLRTVSVGRLYPDSEFCLFIQEWTIDEFPRKGRISAWRNVVDVQRIDLAPPADTPWKLRVEANGGTLQQVWLNGSKLLKSPVSFGEPEGDEPRSMDWGVCGHLVDARITGLERR